MLLLATGLAFAPPSRAAEASSDPAAIAVAEQVMDALGGRAAWDALPGLRWTFAIVVHDTLRSSRRHAWDKHTGWHRVEGTNRAGEPYVIVQNLNDGQGRAWVAGNALEGDSLQKMVRLGKALWVNDSYWFLMPYKLLDPGVVLTLEAPTMMDGRPCDRVAMRFEEVGLTPGDRYWVDVDRETHRVVHWEMVLQGNEPPPVGDTWEGWERHDGLWFPTMHMRDGRNIATRDVQTVQSFPEATFTAP